jgi:hypothetical protein
VLARTRSFRITITTVRATFRGFPFGDERLVLSLQVGIVLDRNQRGHDGAACGLGLSSPKAPDSLVQVDVIVTRKLVSTSLPLISVAVTVTVTTLGRLDRGYTVIAVQSCSSESSLIVML